MTWKIPAMVIVTTIACLTWSSATVGAVRGAQPATVAPPEVPLSATWLGQVAGAPGASVALAWRGEDAAVVEIFEDRNRNLLRDAGEPMVASREIATGIEVVEVPEEAAAASLVASWRPGDSRATVALAPSSSGCEWRSGFHVADLDSSVHALAVYDDGSGPALYVGGAFTEAGEVVVNGIARWDGSAWSALSGPSGNGMSSRVSALAVYDDGSGSALYAGGAFTTAGGITANRIARWDGSAWSALSGPFGNGMDSSVEALAAFDDGSGPALYAGGGFTKAGGIIANRIARWDGSEWSALSGPSGNGINDWVSALTVFDDGSGPALYVGGSFTAAGGIAANFIARWDGSAWSALSGPSGNGMNDDVRALAVYGNGSGATLYAGGMFTTAGGIAANRIARWDGSGWSVLSGPSGNGMDSSVEALAAFDDGSGPTLYAGGGFTTAGGIPSLHIAQWACSTSVDLAVSKTDSIDPVVAGSGAGNLTHTVTVVNNGPGGATGVELSETIVAPAGVTVDSITPSQGSFAGSTWTVGDLATGGSAELTVVFTVGAETEPGIDVIGDTATVTGANETLVDTGDDTATESTSVVLAADLAVTKTADQELAGNGDLLTYVVVVDNLGPGGVTGASVTDPVPGDLGSVEWSCTASAGADCTAFGVMDVNDVVDLPAGGSLTYIIEGTVDTASTSFDNTATVTAAVDPNDANDSDTVAVLACSGPETLTVESQEVSTAELFVASDTLTAGPDFRVLAAGDVTLRACGSVVLNGGFAVEGGKLTIQSQRH